MPRPRTKSDRWVGLPMLMSSSVPGSGQTRLDRQMGSSGSELERPAEALTACWLYHHRDVLRVLYAISPHQERVQQHDPLPRERIQSLSSLNLVRAYKRQHLCSGLLSVNEAIHHLVSSSFGTAWDRWATI